ncbi:hypothetical protein QQ965_03185 [Candidatus Saccharibacteria bacterium oral taxon 955]
MNNGEDQYPQMTYKQAVKHCKYWADQIRHDGLDLLTTDYGAAIGVSDQLAYPLYMQTWIDPQKYYHLYRVRKYAINIYNNYTNRASWEKLLELIDNLPEEYGKNNYPQMTYKQAVKHCKHWADQIRADGLDLLTTDWVAAIGVSDQLAYPLDMQTWIDPQKYYHLYRVRTYAINIDYNNYTDRASWEKLLELIDNLPEEYGKNNYPQMTYKQAVKHCKHWADQIRADGLDLLTTDWVAAIGVSDQLAYPLDMQEWISAPRYPDIYAIRYYAGVVDRDHTDRDSWEKLLELIDKL